MVKTTRKNRFKKARKARRKAVRNRIIASARVVLGLLVLVAVSGGFVFVYDYFTQADHFQVRQIEVTGNRRLNRQQVLGTAGVGPRTNILALNLATTRKRLLADPWIAEATVSRKIPSGLQLHINEEQPLAMLDMGAGKGFLINVSGDVFHQQAPSGSQPLPLIQGLSYADLPVAEQPTAVAFVSVMNLLNLAMETNSPLPLSSIRRIHMDREIGATIYIREGQRAIRLGFGRYRQKCEALGQIMPRLRRDSRLRKYKVIDLFDVDRIVITLAAAGASDAIDKEV
jgi:cell division protein FtsQ